MNSTVYSTDGSADVTTGHTVTERRGSRGQRRRTSLRGAGSSGDTDIVILPPAEAYTVQALMDLSLPRFAGSAVGPQQVHAPWATTTDSPASPATSCPGNSGEENRGELASPCLDLDGLSSSNDDIGTSVGLDDLSVWFR